MNTKFQAMGCLAALLCVALVAGCTPDNRPKTTLVTCTVTYKGELVEGATVAFIPIPDSSGKMPQGATGASAMTDSSGRAKLRAYPEKLGALPGEYYVVLTKIKAKGETGEEVTKGSTLAKARLEALIPIKYGDFRKTGLKATVGTDPLEVTYDLTD